MACKESSQAEECFLHFRLFQGGTNMVINSAGPVSNKNQSRSWLLFNRDMESPPGSDVGA